MDHKIHIYNSSSYNVSHNAFDEQFPANVKMKTAVRMHDNASLHRARIIQKKKKIGTTWSGQPYSPYSSELSSNNYYIFQSLQKYLMGKTFSKNTKEKQTFYIKSADFY